MIKFVFIAVLFAAFLPLTSFGQKKDADALLGEWLTAEGKAKVHITKDPRSGKYHGKIVWLKEPTYPDGKPKVDKFNPNEKLKTKPVIGLNILRDFVHEDGKSWTDGRIYDPDNGKDYSCNLEMEGDKKLKVRGYIGVSLIGRTEYWTR